MPGGVSAYLTFANANRNAVRDELLLAQGADGTGKIGIAQLGKELGSRWRQLSEEEKEVFKAQAREENERRAKEKAEAGAEADAPDATTSVAPTKPPGLPTAVVKRLVLSDPDLKRISAPALNMVIATAEHFIRLMTERSRDVAVTSGKKTIKLQDVLAVAREGGWRMEAILDHLKEVAPHIEQQEAKPAAGGEKADEKAVAVAAQETGAKTAPAVRRITDFFGSS